MDLQAVLSVLAVLLITAGSDKVPRAREATVNQTGISNISTQATITSLTLAASSGQLHLGVLKVTWRSKCEGRVEIFSYPPYQFPAPSTVCHDSDINLTIICQERRGCKGKPHWFKGTTTENGYLIQAHEIKQGMSCESMDVKCSVEEPKADVQGQLRVYKVMTALLCIVLILLLVVRFTKPTVKALQKRLSDRRQNRWIGPTQSHSVSYHREKTIKNDREQRLSYPALERLTVCDSREPSSNRNSDCNF